MKTIDILNKQFTALPTVSGYVKHHGELTDYTQQKLTLKQIISLGIKYRKQIDCLRKMGYHTKEQTSYKEQFPCWLVGGVFPMNKTEDKDILTYSNILAIDIDKKDNIDMDIDELKKKLFELPYVFYVSKSISGQGIYVLILLEDGRYTKEYYRYFVKLFKNKYNINIDEKCTNIARKRFISYDDEHMIKDDDTDIQEWKLKAMPEETKAPQNKTTYTTQQNTNNTKLVRQAIWYLLNNGYSIDNIQTKNAYNVWYHVGCDFRHFEDGEQMFIQFSNNTSQYRDTIKKILSKWDKTRIETSLDDVCRKWCGICKNTYGRDWYRLVNQQLLF